MGPSYGSPSLLVLLDYLSAHPPPDGQLYQLWYLGDGVLIGSCATLASFLNVLQHDGCSFGLYPNLAKCEVFWPSGDQRFPEFPSFIGGPMVLGSPIWGSASFFASFVKEVVEKVSLLQERLQPLKNI